MLFFQNHANIIVKLFQKKKKNLKWLRGFTVRNDTRKELEIILVLVVAGPPPTGVAFAGEAGDIPDVGSARSLPTLNVVAYLICIS